MKATLPEAVAASPKYRTIFPDGWDRQKPLSVFCRARDVQTFRRLLKARHRLRASVFVLPDDDWQGRYRLKMLLRALLRGVTGIRLCLLEELDPASEPALVAYAPPGYEVWMSLRLAQGGFRRVMLFDDPAYDESFRRETDFLEKYSAPLHALCERLQDEDSALTLASVIRHRQTGSFHYLRLAAYPQYGHPVVRAAPGDTVLDVGAEDGGTSITYSDQVGASGRVYAFEPDPMNLETLRSLFVGRSNITTVPLALGEREAEVRFVSQKGGLSHIARPGESGGIPVRVAPVDKFVEENKLPRVDLLKLDTEGYEMPILQGAVETIRRFKPKLQISVYHKQQGRDDLADVPTLISRVQPAYRYYLGHHGSWGNETILYAICP